MVALRQLQYPGDPASGLAAPRTALSPAWQSWRDLAGEVQEAITAHAAEEGKPRYDVEAAVRTKAQHPEPEPANA